MDQIGGKQETGLRELVQNPAEDVNLGKEVVSKSINEAKVTTTENTENTENTTKVGETDKISQEQIIPVSVESIKVEPIQEDQISETTSAIIHKDVVDKDDAVKMGELHDLRMRGYGARVGTGVANDLTKQYRELLKKTT